MAELIPVNILIGDRTYRLKIEPADEEKLRKYLKEDENIEIVNIHGNGFRLVAP